MSFSCKTCGGEDGVHHPSPLDPNGIGNLAHKINSEPFSGGVIGIGETTYSMDAECSNCNWQGSVQLPKGKRMSMHACPNCGCATLHQKRYMM